MSTVYTCESCNSLLRIGAPLPAGKQLKCPSCAAIYTVPSTPETVAAGVAAKKPKSVEEEDVSMTVPLERMPAPTGAPRAHAPSAPGIMPRPSVSAPSAPGVHPKPPKPQGDSAQGTKAAPTGGSAAGTQPVKAAAGSAQGTQPKPAAPKSPSGSGAVPHLVPTGAKSPGAAAAAPPANPPASVGSAPKGKSSDTHDGRSQLADLMSSQVMVRLSCPSCQMALKIPETTPGGTSIRCPRCQNKFKPPWSEEPAAPAKEPPAPAPPPAVAAASHVAAPPPVAEGGSHSSEAESPAEPAPETAEAPTPAVEKPKKKRKLRRKEILGALALGAVVVLLAVAGAWMWGNRDKGPIAEDEWKDFTPPMGHCQVKMPGEPTLQKGAGDGSSDLPRSVLYSLNRPDKDASFTIAYINLPANVLDLRSFDELFAGERQTMLRTTKESRLRNETNFNVNGHFGREFQIEGAKNRLLVQRVIWVEGASYTRIYVLQANVAASKSGAQNATTFLGSLNLPPRMAAPATN